MRDDLLLIGVDGGATEVKAHAVACSDTTPATFRLRPEAAARVYPRVPDFEPVPVAEQLAQRDAGQPRISAAERAQGAAWIACAAEAIAAVARDAGGRTVLVGMGMPGLKTPDQRGIAIINNGPRMPLFAAQLEKLLAAAGVTLAGPIAALGSDADYCGLGEEHAPEGLFRGVTHAYYLGGGTGVADALKLGGRLVPFDAARSWIQKSWQMPSALGPTFEQLVSASAANRLYANLLAASAAPDAPREFPECAAQRGDARARAWLGTVALLLAELIHERLATVYAGRSAGALRGPAYARLDPEHPYRGVLLERVVLGQRIAALYADPANAAFFAAPLEASLAAFIAPAADAALPAAYLAPGAAAPTLRPGLLCASRLRAAPALGAAVAAALAFIAGGR
jgi:hypothetical protein